MTMLAPAAGHYAYIESDGWWTQETFGLTTQAPRSTMLVFFEALLAVGNGGAYADATIEAYCFDAYTYRWRALVQHTSRAPVSIGAPVPELEIFLGLGDDDAIAARLAGLCRVAAHGGPQT
jgi:hypothetical protein